MLPHKGKNIDSVRDSASILWDAESGEVLKPFSAYKGDVMSLSISPTNNTIFVTGSVNSTSKVQDIQDHVGHGYHINLLSLFPDGNVFDTGSDDSTCGLFYI